MTATTERVHFRLIVMPCCDFQSCWVNPRLPSHCPECGARVYPNVRSCVVIDDPAATLRVVAPPDTYARLAEKYGRN